MEFDDQKYTEKQMVGKNEHFGLVNKLIIQATELYHSFGERFHDEPSRLFELLLLCLHFLQKITTQLLFRLLFG